MTATTTKMGSKGPASRTRSSPSTSTTNNNNNKYRSEFGAIDNFDHIDNFDNLYKKDKDANKNKNDRHFEPQVTQKPHPILDPILRLVLLTLQLLFRFLDFTGCHALYQYHRFVSYWKAKHYLGELCKLDNMPTNVAIGINHPLESYDKLKELLDWCRVVGTIRTVTIYHPYQQSSKDAKRRAELKRQLSKSNNKDNKDPAKKKKKKNGHHHQDHMDICILPPISGRQALVEAARHFCTDEEPVTEDKVTAFLKAYYPHPDPQLLLIFGETQIYNGFPCWQIRLTETVFFFPLNWLTLSEFYQAMYTYTKCEQRFGK